MVDQTDPFKSDDTLPPASLPAGSSVDDYLARIKNENGEPKYRTTDEAFKALEHSQAFIPTLLQEKKQVEDELSRLREELTKRASVEEVLEKITAKTEPKPQDGKTPPPEGLSAEAVAELVRRELAANSAKDQATKNSAEVQEALAKKFGDKTREAVAAKAKELGTTPEKLGELAASSPAMVLALFGSSKATATPITSSFNLPLSASDTALERPAKSLLIGATSKDQKAYMQKVKANVYKKYDIQT